MKTFPTKAAVKDYLVKVCGMTVLSSGGYYDQGPYTLDHGEYDRPEYYPRRYKDGWGMHQERATFGACKSGRVSIRCSVDGDIEILHNEN